MLVKKNRINQKETLPFFNANKLFPFSTKVCFFDFLTFHYLIKKQKTEKKLGVVVPKNIFKKAYQRNFLKRKTYLILKKNLHFFPKNLHGIFVFNKKTKDKLGSFKEISQKNLSFLIEENVRGILKKINEKNKI